MVKPAARKRICTSGLVWVKDDHHEFYVSMKERGLWTTKKEAERMITEPLEIVVELPNAKSEPTARFFAQVGSTDGLCPECGEK
jgi:hypothetical protein